jgi:hypothetical protein
MIRGPAVLIRQWGENARKKTILRNSPLGPDVVPNGGDFALRKNDEKDVRT